MKFNFRPLVTYTIASAFLVGCGSTTPAIISAPTENIDTSPLKEAELTKEEKENWGHLDLERDTIPGMGVDRAYAEIIKGRKGKKS